MQFAKWEGLGNDYILLEEEALPAPLTVRTIGMLCDRHTGIGSDGILLRCPPTGAVPEAVARMRIFNPDGSEPEMCWMLSNTTRPSGCTLESTLTGSRSSYGTVT